MGKPKGKSSAYVFFVQHQKQLHQDANPDEKIVFGDFMKECGAKWRELDEQEKEPFQAKAAEDAERYEREMEDYEPVDEPAKRGKKRKKDPNAPKRPQTAFFLFSGENREAAKAELPEGARVGEVAKQLGIMWAECPPDEKKKFQEQAEINKAQYEKDMQKYHAENDTDY